VRRSLLLRKCDPPTPISFHLYYDEVGKDPESFLVEPDILAAIFDSTARPTYKVEAVGRINAELDDFRAALDRYYELVINWKGIEVYVHPKIFRYDKKWVEGVQHPL
jgi:hypothetical protein